MISPGTDSAWAVPRRLRLLVLGVSIYLVFVHAWTWVLTTPVALAGRADFRQFYAAGAMLRAGDAHRLYDYTTQKEFQDRLVSPEPTALPFVSPAYHALFFLPFSVLSYRGAYFAFLAMNAALLVISFALLRPWMQHLRAIFIWLPAAAFFSFMPIVMALIQGQDSILLTTLLIAAFVLLVREQAFYAGVFAGLGLFKLQIVLPLALMFLIWRCWKFCMGFASSAGTLTLLSVGLTGAEQAKLYLKTLLAIAGLYSAPSDLARYPITLEQMANLHGLVYGLCLRWMPSGWLHLLAIFLSFAVLIWTVRQGFSLEHSSTLLLVAIPCSILISHHTYVHDLSVLFLPLVVQLNSQLPRASIPDRASGSIAALTFVAPVSESFSASHFYLVAIAIMAFLAVSVAASRLQSLRRRTTP